MIRKFLSLSFAMLFFVVAACTHQETANAEPVVEPTANQARVSQKGKMTYSAIKGAKIGTYELDKAHAFLTASVSHFGLSDYTLNFADIDANIELDPQRPERSTLVFKVRPESLETFYPTGKKRDGWHEKLKYGAKFFNAKAFPEVTFTSTRIERSGNKKGRIIGELEFLGFKRTVSADVVFNGARAMPWAPAQKVLGFDASLTFNRSDFGLTTLLPNIGDEVTVEFSGEFKKAKP